MTRSTAAIAARARETGRLGHRHGVHGRGPLPAAAVPGADRARRRGAPADGGGRGRVSSSTRSTDDFDPAPLAELLADPDVEVVLHAGRQDVALLRRVWGTAVTNVFDTQVAAGFAGMRAQLGYEPLLNEMLGVRLRKSASFTRWDARPLTDEQLGYAARGRPAPARSSPTRCRTRLRELGRLEWAREECRALEEIADEPRPRRDLRRLPRVNSLDPAQRAVARELVEWREEARARAGPPGLQRAARRRADRDRQAPAADARPPARRSAGSTRPRCAAAARRSSRPSSAAASATPIPSDGERPAAARRPRTRR